MSAILLTERAREHPLHLVILEQLRNSGLLQSFHHMEFAQHLGDRVGVGLAVGSHLDIERHINARAVGRADLLDQLAAASPSAICRA